MFWTILQELCMFSQQSFSVQEMQQNQWIYGVVRKHFKTCMHYFEPCLNTCWASFSLISVSMFMLHLVTMFKTSLFSVSNDASLLYPHLEESLKPCIWVSLSGTSLIWKQSQSVSCFSVHFYGPPGVECSRPMLTWKYGCSLCVHIAVLSRYYYWLWLLPECDLLPETNACQLWRTYWVEK